MSIGSSTQETVSSLMAGIGSGLRNRAFFNRVGPLVLERPRIALSILCLALFVPGLFSLPPLDRDESRFAQASKQMLETGDFVNIRFLDGARNKKPAGIHWMQAMVAQAAGGPDRAGIWAYRMPSVIGALLAVLLLHWAACRLFDAHTALLAAAFLAASISVVAETTISKTDGMLLATIVAMNGILARNYLAARRMREERGDTIRTGLSKADVPLPLALAFWIALSVSLLLKGPIGPMVVGLTVLALGLADRNWTWLAGLRPRLGLGIVAVLVLPWAIAIFVTTGGTYYEEAIGKDLAAKVISAQESHGAPPGYYLALVSLTFFPGSLFLWPALWRAWVHRLDPALRFCLAWIIPTWIVFECFPTKLPHYSMPTYPALALVTAATVMAALRGQTALLSSPGARLGFGIWTAAGVILALGITVLPILFGSASASLDVVVGLCGLGLLGFTMVAAWRGNGMIAAMGGVSTALLFVLPLLYGHGAALLNPMLSLIGLALVALAALAAWSGQWLRAAGAAIATAVVLYACILEVTLPRLDRLGVSTSLADTLESLFGEDRNQWPRIASAGYHEPSLVFLTRSDTILEKPPAVAAHLAGAPDHLVLVESRQEQAFRTALEALEGDPPIVVTLGRVQGYNYSNGRDVTVSVYGRADSRRIRGSAALDP
ncbi:MAG: ArnT family glycosyltransferase [Alphaproteobacteria bacterium]